MCADEEEEKKYNYAIHQHVTQCIKIFFDEQEKTFLLTS